MIGYSFFIWFSIQFFVCDMCDSRGLEPHLARRILAVHRRDPSPQLPHRAVRSRFNLDCKPPLLPPIELFAATMA